MNYNQLATTIDINQFGLENNLKKLVLYSANSDIKLIEHFKDEFGLFDKLNELAKLFNYSNDEIKYFFDNGYDE